jgi:hypothetical protein
MSARIYLVCVLLFVLLIWGPINDSWPASLAIRIGYLIVIPTAFWFILSWIWKAWRPNATTEDRLERTLAGATAGALLHGAVLAAASDHHFKCTQEVRSRDGYECIGDYVLVRGPDLGWALMLTVAAAFAFWFGVRANDPKS